MMLHSRRHGLLFVPISYYGIVVLDSFTGQILDTWYLDSIDIALTPDEGALLVLTSTIVRYIPLPTGSGTVDMPHGISAFAGVSYPGPSQGQRIMPLPGSSVAYLLGQTEVVPFDYVQGVPLPPVAGLTAMRELVGWTMGGDRVAVVDLWLVGYTPQTSVHVFDVASGLAVPGSPVHVPTTGFQYPRSPVYGSTPHGQGFLLPFWGAGGPLVEVLPDASLGSVVTNYPPGTLGSIVRSSGDSEWLLAIMNPDNWSGTLASLDDATLATTATAGLTWAAGQILALRSDSVRTAFVAETYGFQAVPTDPLGVPFFLGAPPYYSFGFLRLADN
jgi:hypothetical protein